MFATWHSGLDVAASWTGSSPRDSAEINRKGRADAATNYNEEVRDEID